MDIFSVLTMIGGLALFLYGMNVMGDGLAKMSGGHLEAILGKMTSSPIKAVLLGCGVTAVMQSSSATTVMAVGFVNSGIMKLSQAVGIIMGANVGTTVTSWILSLSGIESTNFFIQMLKPSSFSPVLAIIGAVFCLFSKNEKKKDIGTILIGFAILMFGMETMSDAVKPLADVPEFANLFMKFSNPILGVLVGAVLTGIIQSSAASIGILQAFCKSGIVSYGAAVPIIMGQNIGTCVTALLSSIGASKNGKRTALVHLYFNVIGTVVFMIIFYAVMSVVDSSFLVGKASLTGIAMIHTTFNVAATLLLLPFAKVLEKLACMTVKDSPEEIQEQSEFQVLDARFLDTPSYAMEQCRLLTVKMAEVAKESLEIAMGLLREYDEDKAIRVRDMEGLVDKYEDGIGTYLVKLSNRNLSEKDSRMLNIILHSIGDFERISDHALNVCESAQELNEKQLHFSEKAQEELTVYIRAIMDIVDMSVKVFDEDDENLAKNVEPLEEVIDHLSVELKNKHVNRLRAGKCSIEMGFVLTDVITNLERVADHCSNIAVCIIQIGLDGFDTHEYIDELKENDEDGFTSKVADYQKNYQL